MNKMLKMVLAAAIAVSAQADSTWTNLTTGVWSDSANWLDGVVGGGYASRVDIRYGCETADMEGRMLQVPDAGVTLGWLQFVDGNVESQIRVWGGPITLDNTNGHAFVSGSQNHAGRLILFAPLQGTNDVQLYNTTLAGPARYTGNTYVYGWLNLYNLCYADCICETVTNQLPPTKLFLRNGACVQAYSHCSWEAFDADFALVEGSRLAVCTDAEAVKQKGIGTPVTGEGVPEGAFFKSSISATTLELNAPATKTGTFTLHVGGVASWQTSLQQLEELNVSGASSLRMGELNNSRLRWEVGWLSGSGSLNKEGYGTLAAGIGADFTGGLSCNQGTLALRPCDASQPFLSFLTMGDATLDTAAGLTLNARNLNLQGAMVKTGDGTLAVDAVGGASTNVALEIREGRVAFGSSGSVRTRCPVAGAWFHVDAADTASMTLVEENGTNFVTRWNDTDGGTVYATAATRPFLRHNALAGKPVVDFGSYHYPVNESGSTVQGYGGSMTWSSEDKNIQEVFMVYADTDDIATIPSDITGNFLLGHTGEYHFHRGLNRNLFIGFSSNAIKNGLIEVDGAQQGFEYALPAGFHLIHLRMAGEVWANAFALNRHFSFGGQRLAEVLVYNRTLTDDEAGRVNDYLNGKWFGGPGVFAMKNLTVSDDASLTVDAGDVFAVENLTLAGDVVKRGDGALRVNTLNKVGDAQLTIEGGTFGVVSNAALFLNAVDISNGAGLEARTDANLSVGRVTGAGTFVKTGAGTVSVGAVSAGVTGLDVRAGRLEMAGGSIPSGAWFHVDASQASSLTTVEENGTNFVTRWNDADGGAVYASAYVRPFLNTNAIPGKTVVDFGTYDYPDCHISGYGASMIWSAEDTGIREVFLVFSDTEDIATISDATAPSFFLGNVNGKYRFHRGLGRQLFIDPYASPYLRDGLIEVDALAQSITYVLPSGFHLVHLRTTGAVEANAFANDRNLARGGQRLAEVIVYNRTLTDAEAAGAQQALLAKWWGTGVAGACAYDAILVGTDAALNLANLDVTVGALTCAGTFTATTLAPSALNLVSDGTALATFTLNGTFAFPAQGTATVTGAALPNTPGRYLVATATGCTGGGNLSSWRVVGEGLPANRSARLVWADGQLLLSISPSGSQVLFR